MKRIDTINDVRSFNFYKNQLVIKKTDETLYSDNNKFKFKGKAYVILENGSFCDIQKTAVEIYDLGFNLLTRIEKTGITSGGKILNSDYFSVRWEDENENEFLSIYKGTEEIKRYDFFFGRYLGTDYRMVYNDYDITKISMFKDIIKNDFLWSYSLPEGFKISSLARIIDNLLFFDAFKNGNEEHFIVGLDINTGKILWQHLYKIPYKEDIIAFTFNQKNKLCYAYLGNWYQIFNPISGEIIFEKKFDNDVDSYVNAVCDDKLWFVSGKYENCKFGYINLITNEIEFLQDFPQENDEQFSKPIFHEGKLYLKGVYYNNLYIFE